MIMGIFGHQISSIEDNFIITNFKEKGDSWGKIINLKANIEMARNFQEY